MNKKVVNHLLIHSLKLRRKRYKDLIYVYLLAIVLRLSLNYLNDSDLSIMFQFAFPFFAFFHLSGSSLTPTATISKNESTNYTWTYFLTTIKCPKELIRLRKDNPLIKRYAGLIVLFLIIYYLPEYFLDKKIKDSFKPTVYKTFTTAADHKLEIMWHGPSGKIPNKILGELINKGVTRLLL